jgi:hypothetical protein
VVRQNALTYLGLDPTFEICFVKKDLLVSLMFLIMHMLEAKHQFFFSNSFEVDSLVVVTHSSSNCLKSMRC